MVSVSNYMRKSVGQTRVGQKTHFNDYHCMHDFSKSCLIYLLLANIPLYISLMIHAITDFKMHVLSTAKYHTMLSVQSRPWTTPGTPILTPDVMYVVEPADLREEPSERLVALPAEVYGASPVVAPLNHRSRLQEVAADFVQVLPGPRRRGWPEAEG